MLESLIKVNNKQKQVVSYIADAIFVICSFWLAYFLRLDSIAPVFEASNWLLMTCLIPTSLFVFSKMGLYRIILRYIGTKALGTILISTSLSASALILMSFFTTMYEPRTLPLLYFGILTMSAGGSRLLVRITITQLNAKHRRKVIIYGAGSAGRQLANSLDSGNDYRVSAFLDDDMEKCDTIIQGIPVLHIGDLASFLQSNPIDKILLAIPNATRSEKNTVIEQLEPFSLKIQTIPNIEQLIDGKVSSNDLVDIELEDLLGREPVEPIIELLCKNISNKSVLVSGAGGSIGSELCRQILRLKPTRLVLFEISEFALYQIEKELAEVVSANKLEMQVIPIVGSIQDAARIESIIRSFAVDTIYHAAAYKHVPMVEHNMIEGVRNNVFGTLTMAHAAIKAQVSTFVLISTDKAVRPTNIMGASKRMAELTLQALEKSPFNKSTRFSMVRFGNVLGSSGSVVPLFKKQIKEGKQITLTHENVRRYFMTIPEAAQLVIQAGAMARGGDVFVLDMGKSVKVKELAERMIRLSGLTIKSKQNPAGEIEIICTGLRPGEKLYEELLIGNNVNATCHKRILVANEVMLDWQALDPILQNLQKACRQFDHAAIRETLLCSPIDFTPVNEISDLEWLAQLQTAENTRPKAASSVISIRERNEDVISNAS